MWIKLTNNKQILLILRYLVVEWYICMYTNPYMNIWLIYAISTYSSCSSPVFPLNWRVVGPLKKRKIKIKKKLKSLHFVATTITL